MVGRCARHAKYLLLNDGLNTGPLIRATRTSDGLNGASSSSLSVVWIGDSTNVGLWFTISAVVDRGGDLGASEGGERHWAMWSVDGS